MLKNTNISGFRIGATYAMPLAKKHSIKLNAYKSIHLEEGPDFASFTVGYQYRWINKDLK